MRLGTRIFLFVSLLILVAVSAAGVVSWVLANRVARASIREQLGRASERRERYETDLYDRLGLLSGVFVSDAGLFAYVAEASNRGEGASIRDLLEERQPDLGYELAFVTDPGGRLLAGMGGSWTDGESLADRPLVADAMENYQAAGLWAEDGRLYRMVGVPLAQGIDLLGFLFTGYPLDDIAAEELAVVGDSEISLLARTPDGLTTLGTTLEPASAADLERALEAAGRAPDASFRDLELAGQRWGVTVSPLLDPEGAPVGLTAAASSLAAQLAPFRRIALALLASGIGAILLASVASFLVARRLTRPIRALATAARSAQKGEYSQHVDVETEDEIGESAAAFNHLLAELREKRDMEDFVAELSRNLPSAADALESGLRQARIGETAVLGVELRRYVMAGRGLSAEDAFQDLAQDVLAVGRSAQAVRGRIETTAGHRLWLGFDGESRAIRALRAAVTVLERAADQDGDSPVLVLASGTVARGWVSWADQERPSLLGRPIQILESLFREATPGEILLSREIREELSGPAAQADVELPQRQGLLTPLTFYTVSLSGARRIAAPERATLPSADTPAFEAIGPGSVLSGRFQIQSLLGSGGMGVVYRARDRALSDVVAVKILRPRSVGDEGAREKIKEELRLARTVSHPHVLRVHDLGEIGDVLFFTMEYVRGVTLQQLLDRSGRVPYSAGLRLARQICSGLQAIHDAGIVHRDLKPDNILLDPTGNARIMDFGIARGVGTDLRNGKIEGTPHYIAPEQILGKAADFRVDVYACGVVFYRLFTGTLPWPVEANLRDSLDTTLHVLADAAVQALAGDPAGARGAAVALPGEGAGGALRGRRPAPLRPRVPLGITPHGVGGGSHGGRALAPLSVVRLGGSTGTERRTERWRSTSSTGSKRSRTSIRNARAWTTSD
ncbi:MAG: protein kinase [Thermoanaerobaculia bacterium]